MQLLNLEILVIVSLAQLIQTMHKICKIRGSNPEHHQKVQSSCVHEIYESRKLRFKSNH